MTPTELRAIADNLGHVAVIHKLDAPIQGKITAALRRLADIEEIIERVEETGIAVVARWDSPDWSDGTHTGEYISRLREALTKLQAIKEAK